MGLFDFLKKKPEETTQTTPEITTVPEGEYELLDGIEITKDAPDEELIAVAEEILEHVEELEVAESMEVDLITKEEVETETVETEAVETETVETETVEAEAVQTETVETEAVETETVEAEAVETETVEAETVEAESEKKLGFFAKLKSGLDKTRKNILGGVDSLLGTFKKIDEDLFEELEELLIMADIGVETTMMIVDNLRKRVKKGNISDPNDIKQLLADEISQIMVDDAPENLPSPSVLLVIGVNGVGKTTTIGKLASLHKESGKSILLAAADTFRAAAIDQLEVWGTRSDIPVVKQGEQSDPAAVVFDAVQRAKSEKTDLLICDTAGRLHNKKNLMEELRKIYKIIQREYPDAHKETYLVLDATTGQNALQQAKMFQEVADITGIILTKLDGTAKGGIVIAIKNELSIPVRYIGVGEGIHDLQTFDATAFAKALFDEI